jgi:hypothetical protein
MRVSPNPLGVSRTPITAVRVRYKAIRGFITDVRSVWLLLDPAPPQLIGFVRYDRSAGQWVARIRGGDNDTRRFLACETRKAAAEWLCLQLGGFTSRPVA